MSDKQLILEEISEEEGIAWITFNRPEKKNAFSRALIAEMIDSLEALKHNEKIRCIVTTGAGDSYSSGRDLYDMREGPEGGRSRADGANAELVRLLRSCPQITIAAVKGYCLGGGLAVINGHDLAIAAETAQLGMPEIIRGSYGATATPTLFHSGIPFKKAFYVQLTGRNLTGLEAERVGLVSLAVPEKELAAEIASRDPAALEHAKIAAYMEMDMEFYTALRTDDLVAHRMRFYTNPLSDVEGYMKSQRGGGSVGYVKPQRKN
ncbi:MAG: enoyl-CoA hydratase/isomerase family protein [Candidatus Binatia bacterium]